MNTEAVFEPADWVAPDLEDVIVAEELAAIPGQVLCPGDHSGPTVGLSYSPAELRGETDERLDEPTISVLSDPRLRVPYCDQCGASL